jgi:hypothetical protein
MIGGSSLHIHLQCAIQIHSTRDVRKKYNDFNTLKEIIAHPAGKQFAEKIMDIMLRDSGIQKDENEKSAGGEEYFRTLAYGFPLRRIVSFFPEDFTSKDIMRLLDRLNGAEND